MNELRWILLFAGALLIAGIYFWGLRSRGRRAAIDEPRQPARFTGGATGFETGEVPASTGPAAAPPSHETRRLEPSIALDDDPELERPAIERRGGDAEGSAADTAALPTEGTPSRREPTFARREEPAPARVEPPAAARREPTFAPVVPDAAIAVPEVADTPETASSRVEPPVEAPVEPARARRPQKIFAVRVTAPGTGRFAGQRVLDALQAEGLRFGRYDIFHSLHADGRPVFSVASLRDPGTFDPATLPATDFPGILVFTVLPGPVGAGEAFDEMLFTARALATHLEGALADEKGAPLTAHRAARMREEALEFERGVDAT